MVSNCNILDLQRIQFAGWALTEGQHRLACQVVFEWEGALPVKWCLNEEVELLCKLASPVKWCLKEKVLLGKWSAIAMLELRVGTDQGAVL